MIGERDRFQASATKAEFNFQMVELAYNNLQGDERHQLMGLKMFDQYLSTNNKEVTSSEVGKEAFFMFMHLAQHGLSQETQSLALSCLVKSAVSEDADTDPLGQPGFLEFLLGVITEPDVGRVNSALKLTSIVFGESSEARQFLIANGLFERLLQNPALQECNVGEIVAMGVRYSEEPTPEVGALIQILMQLLGSGNPDNVCQALGGMLEVVKRQWFPSAQDFEAFHALLPKFLASENENIVSSAFIVLEKVPLNEADFAAVMAALGREDKGVNLAMHFLEKTQAVWSAAAPAALLPALLSCIERLPYERGRQAVMLVLQAMGTLDADATRKVVDAVSPFIDDRIAATSVVRVLLAVARALQSLPAEQREWFNETLSGMLGSLETLAESSNEEQALLAQQLMEAIS